MEQRDGGYYIAGSRIALDCIILAFQDGESQETILCSFPMAGPLVRVYGAIVFYLENKEMINCHEGPKGASPVFMRSRDGDAAPPRQIIESGRVTRRDCDTCRPTARFIWPDRPLVPRIPEPHPAYP